MNAWRDCAVLHELGLWPEFIDCDNRARVDIADPAGHRRALDLFTDRCLASVHPPFSRFAAPAAIRRVTGDLPRVTHRRMSEAVDRGGRAHAASRRPAHRPLRSPLPVLLSPLSRAIAFFCRTTQVTGNYDVVAYRGVQFTLALVLSLLSLIIFVRCK